MPCTTIFSSATCANARAAISLSSMVGPSRKSLVVGASKHTREEPAAPIPARDERIPVGPLDV